MTLIARAATFLFSPGAVIGDIPNRPRPLKKARGCQRRSTFNNHNKVSTQLQRFDEV